MTPIRRASRTTVHCATFTDWQLISTQEVVAAWDYSSEEILAAGGIPYAPGGVSSSVNRYPPVGDIITVETVPRSVGDSSEELVYEVADGDRKGLTTARTNQVTVPSYRDALSLPDHVRLDLADACVITPQRPQYGN